MTMIVHSPALTKTQIHREENRLPNPQIDGSVVAIVQKIAANRRIEHPNFGDDVRRKRGDVGG